MSKFPIATVAKYHKCSGLQKHKLIFKFCRSEVQQDLKNRNHWVHREALLSGGSRRESCYIVFSFPETAYILWFIAPYSTFKAPNSSSGPHAVTSGMLPLLHSVSDNSQKISLLLRIHMIRLTFPLVAQTVKRACLQCRRPGFNPCVGKILWRRKWQPTPVFLPGESHGHGITKSRTRLSDFIFLPIITPSSMIMRANLLFSRFLTLITSAKSLLSCKVTYHRHWGRIWGSLKCLLQRCIQVSQFSPSVVS